MRSIASATRVAADAAFLFFLQKNGAIAQLGERVLCKHEVVGSIPSGSTILVSRVGVLCCHVALFELWLRRLFRVSQDCGGSVRKGGW